MWPVRSLTMPNLRGSWRPHHWPIWSKPFMQRLAHADPWIWATLGVLFVLRDFAPQPSLTLVAIVLGIAAAAGFTSALSHYFHTGQMCLRCAGAMVGVRGPRSLQAWLLLHHRSTAVGVAGFGVLVLQIVETLPVWGLAATDAVIGAAIIVTSQAFIVHNANVAFCPICNRGWGEDPAAEPEPVLDPTPPGKPVTAR